MKKILSTDKAPAAIGPYSQGVQVEKTVYLSGQIGLNPETGSLQYGVRAQTEQILSNIQAVLQSAGLDKKNIVKTTVYLKNMDDFATMNEVCAAFLSEPYPARSTVEVSRLPKGALVEIEVLAVAD